MAKNPRRTNPRKYNDPAKYDRPWSKMAKRVRHLPNYQLPPPYHRAKVWHPGDDHPSKSSITGEPRLPPGGGVTPVVTKILPSDSGHHEFGPSIIEAYSPQHGGCGNHIPHKGTNPQAEGGTRKHVASASGNLEILGGIKADEEEVRWAREQIERLYEAGFKDEKFGGRWDCKFDGEEHVETTFGIEGLNFGTIDRLRYSADGLRAIVIDLKFGAWPVTPPGNKGKSGNLQLLNYALYAFFLHRPMPASVTVALIHVKSRTVQTHIYWRRSVYLLKARIAKIIERVRHGREHGPETIGYYPNPSNCSWCERINCPARLDLANSIISLWTGKPHVLPRPELTTISSEQLGLLKTFGNALQRCVDAINEECRRRAIDCNDIVPGYELKQRSGKRRIVGVANISEACNLVMREWPKWFPGIPLNLEKIALEMSELGVDDLELAAGKAAPRGKILRAKELVAQLLNNPELVQSNTVYYLAAQIPKQQTLLNTES